MKDWSGTATLEALAMHHQSMSAALSFGQGALDRTLVHAIFPPGWEESCFSGQLGAAVLPSRQLHLQVVTWAWPSRPALTWPSVISCSSKDCFGKFG